MNNLMAFALLLFGVVAGPLAMALGFPGGSSDELRPLLIYGTAMFASGALACVCIGLAAGLFLDDLKPPAEGRSDTGQAGLPTQTG